MTIAQCPCCRGYAPVFRHLGQAFVDCVTCGVVAWRAVLPFRGPIVISDGRRLKAYDLG